MRQRKTLTIRRDDHIGDPIGAVFLDVAGADHDAILSRIREYLGPRLRILKAEVTTKRIQVEVESNGFTEESSRLAAAASDLHAKGAPRNAQALFREALRIDPLNGEAMVGLGCAYAAQERYEEALPVLKLAREVVGDNPQLLQTLAHVSLNLSRVPAALEYLEQALALAPNDPAIRRAMSALRKQRLPEVPDEQRIRPLRGRRKS